MQAVKVETPFKRIQSGELMGTISAKAHGFAIVRTLGNGTVIGFRNPGDAFGHPTTQVDSRKVRG